MFGCVNDVGNFTLSWLISQGIILCSKPVATRVQGHFHMHCVTLCRQLLFEYISLI